MRRHYDVDMVSITVDDGRRLHITAERAARHEEVRNKGTFLVYELHPEVPEFPVRASAAVCESTLSHLAPYPSVGEHALFHRSPRRNA
jgi:hypothetical protein